MKRGMRPVMVAIGLLTLIVSAVAAQTKIPDVQSRATLSAPDLDFELDAVAAAPGGEVWAVVVGRPRGNPTATETTMLASFGVTGAVTRTPLELPLADRSTTDVRRGAPRDLVKDMEVVANGRVVLALPRWNTAPSIALVSATGKTLETPRPLELSRDADIQKLVVVGSRLIALGTVGNRPLVAEITTEGKTIWQQTIDAAPALIDSARATRDGGVILLGRRASSSGSQDVWIAKLSEKGSLERSITLPARGGAVTELAGGGYAVVTHAAAARGFDVTLRLLSADLSERSNKPIASGQLNPAFDVAAAPSGGFVVAGTRDRGLWVTHYDSGAAVVWTDYRPPQPPDVEMVSDLKLFGRAATFVLAYTAFTTEGREQRKVVRVVSFGVK